MAMSTEIMFLPIVTASLAVMLGTFVTTTAQAQIENMTMEERSFQIPWKMRLPWKRRLLLLFEI
jgi:hypothetical protein